MPSLNRIILINTHLRGVVELVVDAHTNICGTNASGKTTLQRLVPVFYGEYPSRVVPSTRDSFERWYLPTEQSFICYEYQRMDGQVCQAVLAAAADGKGVAYRLVLKAFDLADYTRSRHGDTLSCLGMAELGRRLKQTDVTATRLLNTREYRAILQNDRVQLAAGANSGELRAFARQFSLCEQGQALRHIEKLVQAVHSREGKMETVRSMIAAILEEDGVSPPTSNLKPPQVDAWIRESRLIQGFDAMRPEFEQLEREYQDLLACERRLSGLRLGYQSDEPRQQRLIDETEAAIAQMDSGLTRLEARWTQQRDDLNQQRSASKGEITRDEGELEQIEQQYQGFLEADLEQARADLDALGAWRDDLENLRGRYRLLTDQHQDVERDFLERCQRIKDQRERQLDELREQQTVLQDQRADQLERQNAEITALQQRQQAGMEADQEGFRERNYGDTLPFTLILVVSGHSSAKGGGRPRLPGRRVRPKRFSSSPSSWSPINGRPIVWPFVRAATRSGSGATSKKSAKLSTRSSGGQTVTKPSLWRRRCVGVLDQSPIGSRRSQLRLDGVQNQSL